MIYKFLAFIFICFELSASNVDEVLKFIAENHVHSFLDDRLSYEQAKEVIKTRKLKMSCGSISHFTVRYLSELGIKCRFILTLTLDQWNDYNNGHSMVEVYDKGSWKLWDVDLKNIFLLKGKQIDARTFCRIAESKKFEIVKFCDGELVADESKLTWYGKLFSSVKGLRAFYKRCCQIEMIRREEGFYFTSSKKHISRITSYRHCGKFIYMDENKFIETFY